jgi:iron(III) transport system permease protein
VAIPGLVIGVGYLWAWIGLPGGLYGTIWILALAFVARFMPDTIKALSTSFLQIHRELEEAAWICGKGLLGTIRTIMLPLVRPGVLAAMSLLFILAIRELGSSLFLYTSDTTVMAVLLLDYYEGGNTGKTAAFSLVQTALLAVLIATFAWQGGARADVARAKIFIFLALTLAQAGHFVGMVIALVIAIIIWGSRGGAQVHVGRAE